MTAAFHNPLPLPPPPPPPPPLPMQKWCRQDPPCTQDPPTKRICVPKQPLYPPPAALVQAASATKRQSSLLSDSRQCFAHSSGQLHITNLRCGDSSFSDDQHLAAYVHGLEICDFCLSLLRSTRHGRPDRTSSSADQHLTGSLHAVRLANLMRDITSIRDAHISILEMRPAMDKTLKSEMKSRAFGTTVNALQRNYSKLLHIAYDDEYTVELASKVRNLSDAVRGKLEATGPDDVHEGTHLMRNMLEHLQLEFKWEKITEIQEATADIARTEKASSEREAKAYQLQLREMGRGNQWYRNTSLSTSVDTMLKIANS
jgi:hypothetical protein